MYKLCNVYFFLHTYCRQNYFDETLDLQDTTLPRGISISNQILPGEILQGCILR